MLGGILRVGLQRMVIVTDFGCRVHEYVERCCQRVFPRPADCPHCHVVNVLIGHGFYPRKALDMLFFERGARRLVSSRRSGIVWLALNMLVLLIGWIVIIIGTTRLTERAA